MDADKLMTKAMQNEARKAINAWVKEQLYDETYDQATKIAKKWVADNEQFLKDMLHEKMEKKFSKVCDDFVNNVRFY